MSTTTSERDDATAERNERYEVQVVITQQLPHQPLPEETLVNALNNFSVITNDQKRASQSFQEEEVEQNDTSCVEVDEVKRRRHLKLYRAALKGDWEMAKCIFEQYPEDIQAEISKVRDTALHIAAAANRTLFVRELVNYEHMKVDYLATTNDEQNTAFCLAAASGNVELVDLMLEKNRDLAQTRGKSNMLPIQMAALLGQHKMVLSLYKATKDLLEDDDLINLLVTLINNYLYDAALLLLNNHPHLATLRAGNEETALHALAQKPLTTSEFANPNQQGILNSVFNLFSGTNMVQNKRMHPKALELVGLLWEKVIMQDDAHISQLIGSPWRIIFTAAEHGNVEFLSKLIDQYPDLIFKVDDHGYSIFHIAVLNRHERIFKLIYETGSIKNLIVVKVDKEENNILHLAAKLPPPNRLNIVSGAALQLQRELLWFQEVKKVVQPLYAEAQNKEGKTPRALFTEKHRDLMEKGEEWMTKTAESCMIVATLIATVVFAAAFTVPGGVKDDTGSPNFLKKLSFIIFSLSDAISLVSSSCSILTFLAILTARYAEEDFLWSLPTKLVLGISTLFISIAAMMVVFCATLFIHFNEGTQEFAILATALASIPVFLFLWQQYRLLLDVVRSTYISNSLFHHRKQTLILEREQNPREENHRM